MKKVFTFLFLLAGFGVMANNLQINNVALTDNDPVAKTVMIRFDISWDNSWRDEINWDAAWVFAKFFDGELPYHHCKLSLEGSLYGSGTPHELVVPNDSLQLEGVYYGVGAFIYRSALSDGTFDADSVRLKWNYGLNGFETLPADIEVHVYGTEMVYIPEGPFVFGDGDGANMSPNSWHLKDTPDYVYVGDYLAPLMIHPMGDEQARIIGIRVHGKEGLDWDGDGNIDNPNFPTGYRAFYIMKYETTQGQYTDFLNSLTEHQIYAASLFENTLQYRYTITLQDGKYVCARPDRACNFLSFNRPVSIADWIGLRPMTALEFEKAARGPLNPVYNEYAWGDRNTNTIGALTGVENGTELPFPVNSNIHWGYSISGGDGGSGPIRAGIFAHENTNRVNAGASYYGVLELSGNLGESTIEMLHFEDLWAGSFRGFFYDLGDGEIDDNGYSNSFNYLSTTGIGNFQYCFVTTRFNSISNNYTNSDYQFSGARFVRNAPVLP